MIPSRSWFPLLLADREAWCANFDMQAQVTGLTLGLAAAQVAIQLKKNNENYGQL